MKNNRHFANADKYKLFAIGLLLITCYGCGDDEPAAQSDCDAFTSVNAAQFTDSSSASFTIISASITGDCLEVNFSSSGCSGDSWEERMVDAGEVLESLPIQRNIRMLLVNNESCAAVFTKTVSFDLSPIQTASQSEMLLNLGGYEQRLLYRY